MPSWLVFDAIVVVWPFSEPFACGGVAISDPFASLGVALCICGVVAFFFCMWKCGLVYVEVSMAIVAFSLHNYVEVWPFLCIYGGVALSMWRCGDF